MSRGSFFFANRRTAHLDAGDMSVCAYGVLREDPSRGRVFIRRAYTNRRRHGEGRSRLAHRLQPDRRSSADSGGPGAGCARRRHTGYGLGPDAPVLARQMRTLHFSTDAARGGLDAS